MKLSLAVFLACLNAWTGVFGQLTAVPFDSERWIVVDGQMTEFLGRKAFMGTARLKDADFRNGVIEFDLAVTGERSYPGVTFRVQSPQEYERIYVRPHLPKTFANVLQYEGTFRGLDSWQLYYGPGKTSGAALPLNTWFHVRIEVKDTQARLFLNDAPQPALFIRELAHGLSQGTLGVWGPKDGSAYFSNFQYRADETLSFPEPVKPDLPLGMIADWEITAPLRAVDTDLELSPAAQGLESLKWQRIKALPSGLVDVSRYFGRISPVTDVIWARTNIVSEKDQIKTYAFGYSDFISVFLNGKRLFYANSAYQSRDGSFQGIVGLNDFITLPLVKGNNELMIAVAESFGGWGFEFRDVDAVSIDGRLSRKWEISRKLRYPESVVHDPKRDALYVSNFTYESAGFISKLRMDGTMEEAQWVSGIVQPTGMCIRNDKLFVVGRMNLIEIDIPSKSIVQRYPFPQPVFPNDIDADQQGNLYITDGGKGVVYRWIGGRIEEWVKDAVLKGANGILAEKGRLLVGATAEGCVKAIDLQTREIKTFFRLSPGVIMDGLRSDGRGGYLVGDNGGRIFAVDAEGRGTLLLDTRARPVLCADFEYIPARRLLVIPTLDDNRVLAYEIKD